MPDLHELEAGRARLVVPFRAIEVTIEYHPERVSGRTMAALRRAQTDNDPTAIFGEVSYLLAEWDLTRDGQPIPLDQAGVESVGALLTMAIVLAILSDFADPKSRLTAADAPTSPSSRRSPRGLSAVGASDTAQTTPDSSSMPDGPTSIHGRLADSQPLTPV